MHLCQWLAVKDSEPKKLLRPTDSYQSHQIAQEEATFLNTIKPCYKAITSDSLHRQIFYPIVYTFMSCNKFSGSLEIPSCFLGF